MSSESGEVIVVRGGPLSGASNRQLCAGRGAAIMMLRGLLLSWSLILHACGVGSAVEEASALCDRYYLALGAGDLKAAGSCFDSQFFVPLQQAEWERRQGQVRDVLGAYIHHSLQAWAVERAVDGSEDGVSVKLTYSTQYEHSTVVESFRVIRVGSTAGPAIIRQTTRR